MEQKFLLAKVVTLETSFTVRYQFTGELLPIQLDAFLRREATRRNILVVPENLVGIIVTPVYTDILSEEECRDKLEKLTKRHPGRVVEAILNKISS